MARHLGLLSEAHLRPTILAKMRSKSLNRMETGIYVVREEELEEPPLLVPGP